MSFTFMTQFMLLYVILMYTGQVFLGLAVYYDAKARNMDMASLWGVITGVLGFIPAIVYLAMRSGNKNTIKCPQCSSQIYIGLSVCPVCQMAVSSIPIPNPTVTAKHCRQAKGFLIASMILIIAGYTVFFSYFIFMLLHFSSIK